jgi:hypothetical protein
MTGPTPSVQPPTGFFGEKKKLCRMSPRPDSSVPVGMSFTAASGRIVRTIRFQSSPTESGMTGWMLSNDFEPLSSLP